MGLFDWFTSIFENNPPPPRRQPSPPPSPPPSPKVLPQEWRKGPWGKKAGDLEFVEDYKPYKDNVQLRCMLYGPVGAGKSSFINSVDSVLRGKITGRAATDGISGKSVTTSYKAYKIQKGKPRTGPMTHYPFVFNDIMGLEQDEGVCVEDIKLAMKGHVKDGYNFNPRSSLSENDKNIKPSLNDRVHVLVCIIPGSMAGMQADSVRKLREVRLAAREMGIPEIAILTKIDETCPEVRTDIKNVYKSKHLKKKIEELSGVLGFPPSCIFPVKNYQREHETSDDTDTLILSALRRMIESGEDFVNDL